LVGFHELAAGAGPIWARLRIDERAAEAIPELFHVRSLGEAEDVDVNVLATE
jgi:hypothetical protein